MANKSLFSSKSAKAKKAKPVTDTVNPAGGVAYAFTAEQALAQYANTGCLTDTYYANAKDQLSEVLKFADQCSPEFIAKCAIYARKKGFMKDMPALLCAVLASKAVWGATGDEARQFLGAAFPQVIDNDKMLRNFVQILRSGSTGRKSMGTAVKRLVNAWFDSRTDVQLFLSTVGTNPSLKDVIKLSRPKPGESVPRQATFKYILDQPAEEKANEKEKEKGLFYKTEQLPELIQAYERFKLDPAKAEIPKVPFQMLTQVPLTDKQWMEIAKNGNWHFLRMNLNTFARHGVFKNKEVTKQIAEKLKDAAMIARNRVMPYQLLTTYQAVQSNAGIPAVVKMALNHAMEHATKNTPSLGDNVWVFPDVSGSMMWSPVTGGRGSATTATRCIDVAALFSACVLRTSPDAKVIPVDTSLHHNITLNPMDTVLTNAKQLASCGGGGTNLSIALEHIVKTGKPADTIIFFSDNMSWADTYPSYAGGSATMTLFNKIKGKNPKAKLICVDLQPTSSTQAKSREDVLNVGGFNDSIWTVLDAFVHKQSPDAWVDEIKAIELVKELPKA